jgi:hypothetical protein
VSTENPFRYMWDAGADPYRAHPFALLGVLPDATQATVEQFATAREQLLQAGEQPLAGLTLQRGDCLRAAQALQDPVLRLAFDLMAHWHDAALDT